MSIALTPDTRLYWGQIDRFCVERNLNPLEEDFGPILEFVEDCRSSRLWSYSTVKQGVAAISAFKGRMNNATAFTRPLMGLYFTDAM